MISIGIDLGTTSVKTAAFDDKGRIICLYQKSMPLFLEDEGHVEIDGNIIWEALKECLGQIANDESLKGEECSFTASAFGESFIPVDVNGRPIARGMVATDSRGKPEAERIADMIGARRWAEISGMPVSGTFTVCKLLWLKENRRDIFDGAHRFCMIEDFVNLMLSGEAAIDYSLASRSAAFDIGEKKWSKEILDIVGVPIEKMSRPVSPGEYIAKIIPEVADELGFNRNSCVVAGGHDQLCALVGSGAFDVGDVADSVGSTEGFLPIIEEKVESTFTKDFGFCTEPLGADRYFSMAYQHTYGILQSWCIDNFFKDKQSLYPGKKIYDYLEESMPEKIGKVLVFPHFAGTATPYFDESATGVFKGLTLRDTPESIYKAVIEGLNFEMKNNMEIMNKGGIKTEKLFVVGGGTKSKKAMEIKANIFNKPLTYLACNEAALLGTAILGAVSRKEFSSIKEAASVMVEIAGTIEPQKETAKLYNEKYQEYIEFASKIVRH